MVRARARTDVSARRLWGCVCVRWLARAGATARLLGQLHALSAVLTRAHGQTGTRA